MTFLADRYFGVAEEALHLAAREPRETGVSRVLAIVSDKIIVGGHKIENLIGRVRGFINSD